MAKKLKIALAGNPNSGKTSIFNNLTGARQHVGNWPGVTVEKKEGTCKYNGYEIKVIDLPGTYSLTAYSLEELVARDFVIKEKPDVVIDIVDASNLKRNLYLTTQFKELGAKVVIALNMSDLAKKSGLNIDVKMMSQLLGARVVPTVGNKNQGMKELLEAVVKTAEDKTGLEEHPIVYGKEVDPEVEKIQDIISKDPNLRSQYNPKWLAIKLLEGDSEVIKVIEKSPVCNEIQQAANMSKNYIQYHIGEDAETLIADQRYGFIAGLTAEAVQKPELEKLSFSDKIDKVITNRVSGLPIFLLFMYALLKFTFSGSEFMVGWSEGFFEWLSGVATAVIPEGLFQSFIVDGIIGGVGGVLGFFPLVLFLFLGIAILEDSGYMARGAFVMDKIMHTFGLHGKSFIPLLIGMGCTVPALMASRTLESRKDRLITMLVNGFIICGAKVPIYALFIGAFFFKSGATVFFLFYLIGIAFAMLMAKLFRVFLLPGEAAPFVMELPPYRVPTIKGILIHMWERGWMYLRKAGTIIVAVAVIIWIGFTFPQEPKYSKDYEAVTAQIEENYAHQVALIATGFVTEADKIGESEILEKFAEVDSNFSVALEKGELEEGSEEYAALEKERNVSFEKLKETYPEQAVLYVQYMALTSAKDEQLADIENAMAAEQMEKSYAGRVGHAIAPFFKPLGFDWRSSIALLAGFAAKEVVVATYGTLYSMGETDPEEAASLREAIQKDPLWTPLKALTFMIFCLIYVPCFVATVVFHKESGSWKWTGFMVLYTTVLAWSASFIVYQGGMLLGFG
ncbi:MAG: ferrous iron transport protein B [Candidatus Aminicenantes bacterium]|nr:MAG: ferrous iron transport protein B [Candidatus Aminicenantes bacterium]